jgi:hypothetical protein
MKRELILVMLVLALGCAGFARADQMLVTPAGTADGWSAGAAGGVSHVCVFCKSASPANAHRTAAFALTGVRTAPVSDVVFTPSKTKPDCDSPPKAPEPASMVLFGTGLIALGAKLRRRVRG